MVKLDLKEQVREVCGKNYSAVEKKSDWGNVWVCKKYLKTRRETVLRGHQEEKREEKGVYISSVVLCGKSDFEVYTRTEVGSLSWEESR